MTINQYVMKFKKELGKLTKAQTLKINKFSIVNNPSADKIILWLNRYEDNEKEISIGYETLENNAEEIAQKVFEEYLKAC